MSDETSSTGSESTTELPDNPVVSVAGESQIPQQPSAPAAEEIPAPVLPVFPPLPVPAPAAFPDPTAPPRMYEAPEPVVAQSAPPPAELFAPAAPLAPAPQPESESQPEPESRPESESQPEPTAADPAPVPPVIAPVASPAPADEPRPASKKGVLIGAGVGVVVLALLVVAGWLIYVKFYSDPVRGAQPGHCLADLPIVPVGEETQVDDARFVDCREADATYRVVGRLDEVSEEAARDPAVCDEYRRDLSAIYRSVPSGGTGYVLCLSQVEHD